MEKIYIAHINYHGIKQSCSEHSRNTARVASNSLKSVFLSQTAYLAGLLHDCGKFTDDFSDYIMGKISGSDHKSKKLIHSFAGVRLLLEKFHQDGKSLGYNEICAEIIAFAIGAHHGLFDVNNADGVNGFYERLKRQTDYDDAAIRNFYEKCVSEEEIEQLFQASVRELTPLLNNLYALADKNFEKVEFYFGMLSRLLLSAVIEGDRFDTASFMSDFSEIDVPSDSLPWDRCLQSVIRYLNTHPDITEIQTARRKFSDQCAEAAQLPSGVYQLNLPTGGGKTLSALRYAIEHARLYQKDHIFYVAPLLSIIDQNAGEIRKAIADDSLILEHHSNASMDNSFSEDISCYELSLESWNRPIIITTLVQILNTLFDGRTSSIRHFHSLANSVIIFDEIQSLPRKTIALFNLTANFLRAACHTDIILCSATQPALDKIECYSLPLRPLIAPESIRPFLPIFRRTEIINEGLLTLEEIPYLVERILASKRSLLIVCNTKNQARKIFESTNISGVAKFHLSAGMCIAHRKETIHRLTDALKRREHLLCVSTQVIEAGIDISFESVIRLSAGLDNVVQSAGRCNRNGESANPGPVYIVSIADEKLGRLSEIVESQNALADLLREYQLHPERFGENLASDDAVSYYYASLFRNMREKAMEYPIHQNTLYNLLSTNKAYVAKSEEAKHYFLWQAFKEAGASFRVFDEGTREIIVPYGEGKNLAACFSSERVNYDIAYLKNLLKQSHDYSVSLFDSAIKGLKNAVYPVCNGQVLILNPDYYDSQLGVIYERKEDDETCSTLIL